MSVAGAKGGGGAAQRQRAGPGVPDKFSISALESRRQGMRKWSTQSRMAAFPTQDGAHRFDMYRDEEPAGEDDAAPVLPTGQQRQCPRLRSNPHMSFNHETIYQSQDGDFFWFRPHHRRASRRDVEALDRLLSGMTGRNADLKPDKPPQELLRLLPRMSTDTEVERDLVLTSLRIFRDVLRCKEVGSVNTDTIVKEIRNAKGVKGGLNLTLNESKQQTRQLFMKNIVRQVGLGHEKQRVTERFHNSAKEIRLMKADIAKQEVQLMQAKHNYLTEKRKDEQLVCTMYDNIASDLENQRQFWDDWMRQDGPADEAYQAVSAIFGDRAMRQATKKQMSDPVERAKTIDLLAHAYADAQIRQGANLVFNDAEFEEGLSTHKDHAVQSIFSFRDEPEIGMSHLSVQELKQRTSELYMKRRPMSAASRLEQRLGKVADENAGPSSPLAPAHAASKKSMSRTVSWDSDTMTAECMQGGVGVKQAAGLRLHRSTISFRGGERDTEEEQTCAVCTQTFPLAVPGGETRGGTERPRRPWGVAPRSDGSGSICCPKGHHLCSECTHVFVHFIFHDVRAAWPVKVCSVAGSRYPNCLGPCLDVCLLAPLPF